MVDECWPDRLNISFSVTSLVARANGLGEVLEMVEIGGGRHFGLGYRFGLTRTTTVGGLRDGRGCAAELEAQLDGGSPLRL